MQETRFDAFCGWGEIHRDVGINVYEGKKLIAYYDLSIEDAEKLAAQLLEAAKQAKILDKSFEEYCERHP